MRAATRQTLCLAAALALAFAPAPLPRRGRGEGGDDLKKLQGAWERVLFNGAPERVPVGASIKGDRMVFSPRDAWIMTLDQTARPKRIDFVHVDHPKTVFRGVYKLEGDTLTCSLRQNVAREDRARDFDTTRRDSWVGVYRRK